MYSRLSPQFSIESFLIVLLSLLLPAFTNAQTAEQPLNGVWEFKADFYAEGEKQEWFLATNNPVVWDEVLVPANWHALIPYQQFDGVAWYRKQIELPYSWADKSIALIFKKLPPQSKVWLNGEPITGKRTGNEVTFSSENHWNLEGENTLVVSFSNLVEDTFRAEESGILGDVILKGFPNIHLKDLDIAPTLNNDLKSGVVSLKGKVINHSKTLRNIEIHAALFTYGEDSIRLPRVKYEIDGGKELTFKMQSDLKRLKQWSFSNPVLYHLQLNVIAEGDTLQSLVKSIGFHRREIQGTTLKLNGNATKINGLRFDVNLVGEKQNQLRTTLQKLKLESVSMIEIPFRMLSEELLSHCDDLGLLVTVSLPQDLEKSFGTDTEWMQTTVQAFKRHPCLLSWIFRGALNSKWVRIIKGNSPNNLVAQWGSSTQGITDNRYANYLILEIGDDTIENLKKQAVSLKNVPFWLAYTGKTTRDLMVGLSLKENLPTNIVGVLYKSEAEVTKTQEPFLWQQRQHYGIDSLVITHSGQIKEGKKLKTLIEVRPKKYWQLPSYPLENHWLVWRAVDTFGKTVAGGGYQLKRIEPSDKSFIKTFDWKVPKPVPLKMIYQVLSPQQVPIYTGVVLNTADWEVRKITEQTYVHPIVKAQWLPTHLYIEVNKKAEVMKWQVQYSTEKSSLEQSQLVQFAANELGIYLKKHEEKAHFLRIRSVNRFGEKSEWSQALKVMAPSEQKLETAIRATVREATEVFIDFVRGSAASYSFEYKGAKESKWKETPLFKNTAWVLIDNLNKREKYSFKLRLHDSQGKINYISPIYKED